MRLVHIFCPTFLAICIIFISDSQSLGQCNSFELSEDESVFLSQVMGPNGTTQAFWNDEDAGRLHCYFGLDTIVWREGRLDSIYWGKNLRLPSQGVAHLCGVYRDAVTWMYRGQLHLLGKATGYSSGMDLLACNPSTGWERLTSTGEMPEVRSALQCARIDTNTMLFFCDDGMLMALDLSTLAWTTSGRLMDKFVAYLGEFLVVDLADYVIVFGKLGGGLIQKSTMEFVTNYDLRMDLVLDAQSLSMHVNTLTIHSESSTGDDELTLDAVSMYSRGASMVCTQPAEEEHDSWNKAEQFAGIGWFGLGVGLGSLLVGVYFRRRTHEKGTEVPHPAAETTTLQPKEETLVVKPQERAEHQLASRGMDEPIKRDDVLMGSPEDRTGQAWHRDEPDAGGVRMSNAPDLTQVSRFKRRAGLEELVHRFQSSDASTFNATELNVMLGIELDASEESQRARRARMVKQLNELSVAKSGRKLIVRERDTNDRRHLLYRINK